MVVIDKKQNPETPQEEKQWENPVNPEKPADSREDEQLLRQYKEAKRRKENLTDDEETEHTN
ncbi:hypothetical protein EOD41_17785 [Mucilaginibacter limnophilus]|uniref:Uncharacterized protein n=1 Tax=Mucilaginibacter limnophilus TaxID=1932778 RepID=A0A3S2V024_9SPHI|nr:hypothetical protein [Mucilaginibacter limnophilus]RVT98223.1 hypothetical protein EOD41_17785 [Mucilaginibacter limnophilus]